MLSFSKIFAKKSTANPIASVGNYVDAPDTRIYTRDYNDNVTSVSAYESMISFSQMELMYLNNVWVRACVDKIVERSINIKPIVKTIQYTDEKEISDSTKKDMDKIREMLSRNNSQYETLDDVRRKFARDILKFDAASIEIVSSIDSKLGKYFELFSVAGNTIKKNIDKRGMYKNPAFTQINSNGESVANFKLHNLIYAMQNPQANRHYGLSPLETLVQTVTAELYSSQYNLEFFENNATPRFAVLLDQLGLGQGTVAAKRFAQFWDNELKGKPHRPIVITAEKGQVRFEKVAMSNSDMEFMKYSAWLLLKIMALYKVQPAILGFNFSDTMTNKADTKDQIAQFKVEAIQPLVSLFFNKLNTNLVFNEKGYNLNNVCIEYDLDIVDKESQSKWHEAYLRNGILTINEIRQMLGLSPVDYGNVPYLQNNVAPFGQGPNGNAVPPIEKIYNGSLPVGWETLTKTERKEVLKKLIKVREKEFSNTYFFMGY